MRQQSDTPQKTALRTEMQGQTKTIAKLRTRVQDVQSLAFSEMEMQQRSFQNVVNHYEAAESQIKIELVNNTRSDILNEERSLSASLRNEEYKILNSQELQLLDVIWQIASFVQS